MKMNRSRNFPFVLLIVVNFLFNSAANAGVVKRSIRMVREVYPPDIEPEIEGNQPPVCIVGDVVYGADEPVPAEQPCLKCRCQPPGVQCETVQCAKKPGCKAIHRSNKCCPDYQCECEYNGRIYANGQKLETNPGGECKVCYCRGGEVQCAEVSCYIRHDCEGKRVPGTCCPKYDHCPPIDSVERSSIITEPPQNTLKPVSPDLWQESNTTEVPNFSTLNSSPEDSNKVPDTSDLGTIAPTFTEIEKKDDEFRPRITIQEIIPERKEIPITAPPKIYISEPQGTLLIEEALPTSENSSNDLNIDAEPESSEVSEVFQHPPPVLRIGDKLLYLKKGELVPQKGTANPESIITIIGAEGLQRGGVEESLEVHEVKIEPGSIIGNIKHEETVKVETVTTQKTFKDMEKIYDPLNNTKEIADPSNDLELRPAESTHILSLVKRKTTTQAPTTTTASSDSLTTLIDEPQKTESMPVDAVTTILPKSTEVIPEAPTSTIPPVESKTETQVKNTEEQNPAYPPLPDVMPSIGHKTEVDNENDNSTMNVKILPEVFDLLSNKTKNQTEPNYSEWLKSNEDPIMKKNESLIDFKAGTLPDDLLNERAPIDEVEETTNQKVEETTIDDMSLLKDVIANDPDVKSLNMETTTDFDDLKDLGDKSQMELIAEVKINRNDLNDIERPLESPSIINIGQLEQPTEPPRILTIGSFVSNPGEDLFAQINKTDVTIPADSNLDDILEDLAVKNEEKVPKSIESLEVDSGEQTTPKTNHSSLVSNENISVEGNNKEGELTDMVKSAGREGSIELGSVELSDPIIKDVEMISKVQMSTERVATMKPDVEVIDVELNHPEPTKLGKIETSTYELLPMPQQTKSDVKKRDVSSEDNIFKDLEKELTAETLHLHSSKSPQQEREETDEIFKELLDESNNKKTDTKPKSKEQEQIDSLSNALAGIALKGQIPDAKVFRLIGGLFGGQRQ